MAIGRASGQLLIADTEPVCNFCKIAKNESTGAVVFEDALSMAFLDIRPLFPGHVLLIPKAHYRLLEEIPHETAGVLFSNVRMLSKAVRIAMDSDGTFIAINENVSQSVPHLHVHIVPRKFKDGLKGFFWPRHKYGSEEELKKVKEAIKRAIEQTGDDNGR